MQYPLNEIFQTIQGEGFFTGTPAIFIRLQGCPVKCSWCDTKYTWEKNVTNRVNSWEMLIQKIDSNHWTDISADIIIQIIKKQCWTSRHVVITGGEPCIYDLNPLTYALEHAKFTCQIETSGTQEIKCTSQTWVTLSPKINQQGRLKILPQALNRCNEIKHPVGRQRDIDELDFLLKNLIDDKHRVIALQPISQKALATDLCIKTCILRNWKLSLQTHKYLNIS